VTSCARWRKPTRRFCPVLRPCSVEKREGEAGKLLVGAPSHHPFRDFGSGATGDGLTHHPAVSRDGGGEPVEAPLNANSPIEQAYRAKLRDSANPPRAGTAFGAILPAGATRHARRFFAARWADAVWVRAKRCALRLLHAAQDAPPLALAAFGPLLLGDGLGPFPSLFVHTVRHGVVSNTLHRAQRSRTS
jgi:hypothetical protein